VIPRPGIVSPFPPSLRPCVARGHFRYGVERAKRFVNVHWHCTVSNMGRISKISSLPHPLENVFADARASDLDFFKFLAFSRNVLVVSYLQIQQTKIFEL